jgi:DNA polymerase kappa
MKLRLMGLRCTHLVSTKKPDTMAFFGMKRRAKTLDQSQYQAGRTSENQELNDESQALEAVPVDGCLQEGEPPQLSAIQGSDNRYGRHGKELVANPKKKGSDTEEERWDCPVCFRPHEANEKAFNDHIDLCLSRQTIRDAVQCQAAESAETLPPESKRQRLTDKKRGRAHQSDPKQKRLAFA